MDQESLSPKFSAGNANRIRMDAEHTINSKMTERQRTISTLLHSLPPEYTTGITPATPEQIEAFRRKALAREVPIPVIEQLCDLYSVADEFMYDVIMGFHPCTDDVLFEWWNHGELWMGQRDFNTLRWADGKFCLGDAGDISYSKADEFETLIGLIEGCIRQIRDLDN